MAKSLFVQVRLLVVGVLFAGVLVGTGQAPATGGVVAAPPTSVGGGACSYQAVVSLFGGPRNYAGCGQPVSVAATAASPLVETPPMGGTRTADDANGARGSFGPAVIFGGIWPETTPSGPPSGPLHAETTGVTGPGGSVTSSTSAVLYDPPPPAAPGGIGPGPIQANEAHSTCTANESGLTGSASFVMGILTTSTTEDGSPLTQEAIPPSPEANYTRTGTINNVGDSFRVVFNEQIIGPNQITVNAVHMYLLGPTAVGDLIIGQAKCSLAAHEVADFTGNGKSDFSVFRPSDSSWWVKDGTNSFWGIPGDIPVPGDYDGNGTTDVAVYRPSTGAWYVLGGTSAFWGTPEDIPVPADYDGNGTTDIAVFRPSTGAWYVLGGPGAFWGTTGDVPVPGDYNADGKADFAVYRPSTRAWYVAGFQNIIWGIAGDVPVPGDYNGNGQTEVAVYRPSTGAWFVYGGTNAVWGSAGDVPQPGDYNGDGTTDFAVYQPSTGTWAVAGGASDFWGLPGDIPLPLPYAVRNVFFPTPLP